jgi:hypothetical protein
MASNITRRLRPEEEERACNNLFNVLLNHRDEEHGPGVEQPMPWYFRRSRKLGPFRLTLSPKRQSAYISAAHAVAGSQ